MAIPPRSSQNTQSNRAQVSRTDSSDDSVRRRPNWVNASVNLPSTIRVTTESLDPRIEDSSRRR